ncbi:hypothetical protein LTS08_001558 [Lithohypha guttulata]|nr:hypothetical protein LTS08_001558 [Lithohypha guttulata]
MSRKPPTDTFTRFTSTTPSFSSSPSFNSSPPSLKQNKPTPRPSQPSQPAPASETPQQRVARLRAAHLAKRAAELSTSDRILARGRRVADVLHRGTTYTLLGFSAVASVVAAYGLISLISHNRTQKRAWIEREMDRLEAARSAFLAGTADAEQLHLLEQERAGEELKQNYQKEKQRRKEEGYFTSVKNMFRSSAAAGDMGAEPTQQTLAERGQSLRESERRFQEDQAKAQQNQRFTRGDTEVELQRAAVSGSSIPGVGLDEKGRPVPLNKMQQVPVKQSPIVDAIQGQGQVRRPGQLDMLADNISSSGSSLWYSLFGGSRS